MSGHTYSSFVPAPIETVFSVFSDIPHCAERITAITHIEMLTEGPVSLGTRWKETRVVFKKEATEEMEITSFEPNSSYVVSCESCGALFTTDFQFRQENDGTRVEISFDARPQTFFAKLMSPLSKLMMKSCVKAFDADFRELSEHCQSDDASASRS